MRKAIFTTETILLLVFTTVSALSCCSASKSEGFDFVASCRPDSKREQTDADAWLWISGYEHNKDGAIVIPRRFFYLKKDVILKAINQGRSYVNQLAEQVLRDSNTTNMEAGISKVSLLIDPVRELEFIRRFKVDVPETMIAAARLFQSKNQDYVLGVLRGLRLTLQRCKDKYE